eukprot:2914462-Rhodomonas_salina.1
MSHPSASSSLQSRSSACWSLWCGVDTTTPVVQLIVTGRAHSPSPPAAQVCVSIIVSLSEIALKPKQNSHPHSSTMSPDGEQ